MTDKPTRGRLAVAIVAALMTTSCSGDSSTADATRTTTTTTDASNTTITEAAPACPGRGALPDQAANNSLAAADTNGDGMADTLHSYTIGDPAAVGAWWLQVSFADSGGTTLQITDPGTGAGGTRVYDGSDLNGDGKDEFFAKVGAGASVSILGLFEVVDCTLRRVTIDGQPSEFAVGGSVNFVSGLECFDADADDPNGFIIIYSGQRLGETTEFEITAAHYALEDGALELILADGIGADQNDADFAKFRSAGCPGLFGL